MVFKCRLPNLQDDHLKITKGSLSTEILSPLVVHFFNLLVSRAKRLFNLRSSKVFLLDKRLNHMVSPPLSITSFLGKSIKLKPNQVNRLPSPLGHLFHRDNLRLHNPSRHNCLGSQINSHIRKVIPLARQPNLQDICLVLLNLVLSLRLDPSLDPRLYPVSKCKVWFNPNQSTNLRLLHKRSLGSSHLMVTINPRGNLCLPHIKTISNRNQIFTVHLWDHSVTHGMLGGKTQILMDNLLWGKTHLRQGPGGNHHLVGPLVLRLISRPRCPLILNYHF